MATSMKALPLFSSALVLVGLVAACATSTAPTSTGGSGGELTGANGTAGTQVSSSSHAATSNAASTATSTSNATSASTTVSTGAVGPMCTDAGPGEPNNTFATAFALPGITDCDSDAAVVHGMLDQTGNDVDWYKFAGDDTFGCSVDPARQLIGGASFRFCKYIDCTNGDAPNFSCPSNTTSDTQSGHPGCCWTGGMSVDISMTCGSTSVGSDSAEIYFRVDHPGGPGCESYQVNYHF